MSIDLIRQKQQELAAAKAAQDKAAQERKDRAASEFAKTGIPALWEQLKDLRVPHWRGNASRDNEHTPEEVPLSAHAKKITDTALHLRDWDDEIKVGWYVEVTDKGAVWFIQRGRAGTEPECTYTPEKLRDKFVDYMAAFLPPLENSNG